MTRLLKYLVITVFVFGSLSSMAQTPTGTKTRTPGVWLSSKDTATNRTSADSIQIIANRADSSLRFYWSVGAPSRKIAFGNDLALKLNISDTSAMLTNYLQKFGSLTNRRVPFVNNLGQLKDTAGFLWTGGVLAIPGTSTSNGLTTNGQHILNGQLVQTVSSGQAHTIINSVAGSPINGLITSDYTGTFYYGVNGATLGGNGLTGMPAYGAYSGSSANTYDLVVGGSRRYRLTSGGIDTITSSSLLIQGDLKATLSTAAQPNITSLGTLTGLTVSGGVTTQGNITINPVLSGSYIVNRIDKFNNANIIHQTGGINKWGTGQFSGNTGWRLRNDSLGTDAIIADIASNILSVTGITASGSLTATTVSGTLSTAAQPNITSLGTLTGLTVSGSVSATFLDVASNTTLGKLTVNGSGAPTTSIIQSGASGDIIRFGNSSNNSLVTIGYTGIISAPSVSATSLSGTLSTTAQPNITSLGTLSQLTVTGAVTSSVLSATTMAMGPTTNFAGYRYAFAANSGNGLMIYQDNQDKYGIRQWIDNVTDGGQIDLFQPDGSTIGTRIYGSGITSTSIATGGANQAVYANTNGLLTLTPSDSTMKTDVKNLSEFGLSDIRKLNLVSFKWDSSKGYDTIYGKQLNFGGLAQQFARVNKYFAGYNSNKKHYFIDYDAVRIAHLKATQQLATKVDELKAENDTLKSELEAIKAILLKNNIK